MRTSDTMRNAVVSSSWPKSSLRTRRFGALEISGSLDQASRKSSGTFPAKAEAFAELEIINARIEVCRRKLELLKSSNPYLLKDKLDDAAWVTKTVSDLKEQTEQHAQACEYYLAQYNAFKERPHE